MRRFLIVMICCIILIAFGCGAFGGVHEQRLVGNLGLFASKNREAMAIVVFNEDGNYIQLVSPTVFGVGWDQSHIVVKSHPWNLFDGDLMLDRSQIEYYIVVVSGCRVFGPFGEQDFVLHCDILGVGKDLGFTQVFRDLE